MTPEVRIHVLLDQTNLETGWDESGQSWRDLRFGGHTVRQGDGDFPEAYRFDLSLSDTPGYIDVPWIKGEFGGVAFFYPDDDPESDLAGIVSCQIRVPSDLFTDCLRLSSRLLAQGGPLVANVTTTRIEGGRKGEKVLAFSMSDRVPPQ